jgi:hypothetical protein
MSEELEKGLRQALRPIDPGERFTAGVMARTGAQQSARLDGAQPDGAQSESAGRVHQGIRAPMWRWLSGTALILVVVLWVHTQQVRHMQEGLAARQALMQALQVTAKSLELAQRAVNDSSATNPARTDGV